MSIIKIEDLRAGMKVKLKTFEECIFMPSGKYDICGDMVDKFDSIHTIARVYNEQKSFQISGGVYIYETKWIEEVIEEPLVAAKKTKKTKSKDFIFVEDYIIRKDLIKEVDNSNVGCMIHLTDGAKRILTNTSSADIWKLLSE
tara:strand:- start:32 stop:460 length:429 start_codon:yes stop_codon:yes gene_type:complete